MDSDMIKTKDEIKAEDANKVIEDEVPTVTTPSTPVTFKSFLHTTRKAGKRNCPSNEARDARDLVIAEYYDWKRKCMELQYTNLELQNEKIRLEIEKLKKS